MSKNNQDNKTKENKAMSKKNPDNTTEEVKTMQTSIHDNGTRYRATVPDTLDLAERARLAINALTGSADERFFYESCQCSHLDHRTPYMNWAWNGPCMQKPLHALPLLRVMSGSTQNADIDEKMLDAVTRDIDADGLWWMKVEGRPWRQEAFKEDQVWPCVQGRLIVALLDQHRVDPDPKWLELAGRLARGLIKIALRNEDRAWYHTAYTRNGWKGDSTPSAKLTGSSVNAPAHCEPPSEVDYNIGSPLRGLARWYAVSGDKQALDLADRLARFYMKPMMWGSTGPEMLVGVEHGHWQGHFHNKTFAVMGLLTYAMVRGDARILRFVQEFYEYARCFGIARMGFFPAILRRVPPAFEPQCDEGCAVADMIWLAANLSRAGVGDYWDDVDQYTRNHLVEHQLVRRDLIEAMVAVGPEHKLDPRMQTDERVIERNLGSFSSGGDPTWLYGWWTMCCTGNCAVALHVAWDSILSHQDGVVQVNLLLNRASAWLDVDSHLPHEGKVTLKNKTAHTVYLRKPLWADKAALRCRVDGKAVTPHWVDNYLAFPGLSGKEEIVVEFPVSETTETYTLPTYFMPNPAVREVTCDCVFPERWMLFGPVGKNDPEPDFARMAEAPAELLIAGQRLQPQRAVFTDHRLDLGALLGGKAEGKTAYLLATIEADRAMEVTLGAGADWWMKWWVNGTAVCDTTASGNGNSPPSVCDQRFTARLKVGRNLIAVKVVSGSDSFVLAAGGPRELLLKMPQKVTRRYTLRMRGNTVVDISPRPLPDIVKMYSDDGDVFEVKAGYPIYLRDELRADKAPLKTVERYVAPRVV